MALTATPEGDTDGKACITAATNKSRTCEMSVLDMAVCQSGLRAPAHFACWPTLNSAMRGVIGHGERCGLACCWSLRCQETIWCHRTSLSAFGRVMSSGFALFARAHARCARLELSHQLSVLLPLNQNQFSGLFSIHTHVLQLGGQQPYLIYIYIDFGSKKKSVGHSSFSD